MRRAIELRRLNFYDNDISELDLNKNTALTGFICRGTQLTKLDFRNNPALKYLDCFENQLTGLDVSNNSSLESLRCYRNNMSADALNTLLRTLPNNPGYINISENPGIKDCDTSIAKEKGWHVVAFYYE